MPGNENITSMSSDAFDKKLQAVEDTYKPQPKNEEERKEMAKEKALEQYKEWKEQLEKADKIPPSQELKTAYEGATCSERVALTRAVMNKAFEKVPEINEHGGNFFFGKEFKNGPKDLIDAERDKSNPNKPQVWYKEITQEKRVFFKKTEVVTDNVLVVARLNNEKDSDNGMVAIKLGRQLNGKLLDEGYSTMIPESQYKHILNTDHAKLSNSEKVIKDMLEGNLTIAECDKRFKRYMGSNADKFWKKEDKRILESGSLRSKSEAVYPKMLEQLENDYTEQLQQLETRITDIEKNTKAKEEAFDKKVETVKENPNVGAIVSLLEKALIRQDEAGVNRLTQLLEEIQHSQELISKLIEKFSMNNESSSNKSQTPIENQPVDAESSKNVKTDISKATRNAEMWRGKAKSPSAVQENLQVAEEDTPGIVETAAEDSIEETTEAMLDNAGSGPNISSEVASETAKPEEVKKSIENEEEDDPFYFETKMKKKEVEQNKGVDSWTMADEYDLDSNKNSEEYRNDLNEVENNQDEENTNGVQTIYETGGR